VNRTGAALCSSLVDAIIAFEMGTALLSPSPESQGV
jgi:hypothetical protein